MSKKCNKYESLFLFGTEKDLQEHLKLCLDCQKEHNQFEQVKNLVKEVKPFIKNKTKFPSYKLKIAACFIVMFVGFFAITLYSSKTELSKTYNTEFLPVQDISVISEMGLPTDEYGLLVIE